VIAACIAVISAIALGVYAVRPLALGGDADVNWKTPRAEGSSAFLSLLRYFPQDVRLSDDVVRLQFNDYARARQLLDTDPPKQDALRSEIQDYAGALSAQTGISGYLANTWGLGSRGDDWNSELGFNLTNFDQSLELHVEHRSNPPPEVVFRGRFDAGRAVKAARSTSSFSSDVGVESHAGVTFLSWGEDFVLSERQANVRAAPEAGPWPAQLPGRIVLDKRTVAWSFWTQGMKAIIEASSGRQSSLANAPVYQQLDQAFKDLGVYWAMILPGRDPRFFDDAWRLVQGVYGRAGPIEQTVFLQPWQGLAVGAGYDGSESYAIVVLLYDDAQVAASNVEILKTIVDSGVSLHMRRPWREMITKNEIEANGNVVMAKFWSPNIRLTQDAWNNLDSLLIPRP
jgi:hypothetical protein